MRSHKYLKASILFFVLAFVCLGYVIINGATGTPSTLVVRTDANNYLLVTSATQTNPVTQGVFASRTLRTDSNGSLQVVLTGTVTPTYPMSIPASTCAAPSLGMSGGATTGIAFTATPSIIQCIAGVGYIGLFADGLQFKSTSRIDFSSGVIGAPSDISLSRTAAALLGSNSSMAITRGTITTDLPVQTDTVTWNAGGVTFTGWKLVVTDTASAAASLLMDLQTAAGGSRFSISKSGNGNFLGSVTSASRFVVDGRWQFESGGATGKANLINAAGTTGVGFKFDVDGILGLLDNDQTTGAVLELTEQTAPSAGAANTARIYAVDNGAGKTQVCALFNTGAAQCFATQP